MGSAGGRPERWLGELEAHAQAFVKCFGASSGPRLFFSPGRVNLMGGHLDYNGGPVMPTAVDRGTFIAARPRADRRLALLSTREKGRFERDLESLPAARAGRWFDYPVGVAREILDLSRGAGVEARLSGAEILFGGNLAVGAGLSSSASICVGTAVALDRLWGLGLARVDLVHAALRAERQFVGVRCGIMDPYAVGFAREGHLLWLDCKDASSEHIPLDLVRCSVAVADTGVRRELARGSFNERVAQCAAAFEILRDHCPEATCLRDVPLPLFESRRSDLEPTIARRAEHVLHEVQRTFAAKQELLRGDIPAFGATMARAHASLRDLFEVSVPELDQLVESAVACPGVHGARLTGAGFGGCAVVLLEAGAREEFAARLAREFQARFGRAPTIDFYGGDSGPREIGL